MIQILIAGDFCPQERILKMIDAKAYAGVFGQFLQLFSKVDYNVVNLECPVLKQNGSPIKKVGSAMYARPGVMSMFKEAGINLVTLANNHFYDFGQQGITDTIESCQVNAIDFVGGGIDTQQATQTLYRKIKGVRFAFINVCENEFSIAADTHGGSNPLDIIINYNQIREAKAKADYVIVITHGGHEYYQLPSPRMQSVYRFFVDAGASAVVNHHTHCYSGYEVYRGSPIFYSLGNFSFDWHKRRNDTWNEGYAVVLEFANQTVAFKTYPYIQGNQHPGIVFMNDRQRVSFEIKITQLNDTIQNDEMLKKLFNSYCLENRQLSMVIFEPYSNKVQSALFYRKWIPSFLGEKRLINIVNKLFCESHRDVLFENLKHEYSKLCKREK